MALRFWERLRGGHTAGEGAARWRSTPKRRSAEVGWLLDPEKGGFVWDAPKPYTHDHPRPQSAKSAVRCPGVVDFDARHFVVRCPFDLHLRLVRDNDGRLNLTNVSGHGSAVRQSVLGSMIVIHPAVEWRHPERFLMQIATPYIFVTDDLVWANLLPPFLDYKGERWPGVMIGGRFPLHIWPRKLMWAFEWHELEKDLVLKRGEPWFLVRFEPEHPAMTVRLSEAEMTPELRSHLDQMTDVSNYTNQTFELFKTAEARRPATLFKKRTR